MNDNPTAATADFRALPDHAVLEIAGPDALAFAQAQFMNDVAALADGQWHWNGWLNAKGRLIALFALLRRDATTAWLVLPDADAAGLASQLQRYVFRSKLKLAVRSDLDVSGSWHAAASDARRDMALQENDAMLLDWSGDTAQRSLRISPRTHITTHHDGHSTRWKAADLLHGVPRLSSAQSERWTPQQLRLDRLHAYSVRKGCYPGQEIVARTHFLGEAKRALHLLECDGVAAEGDAVIGPAASALGEVIAVAGRTVAWIGSEAPQDLAIMIGGTGARPLPRQPGLAR